MDTCSKTLHDFIQCNITVALAQSARAFAPQAEGLMFEYQPRKTGSDSSTVKRSTVGESGTYKRMPPVTVGKNPHCSMAMSAGHMAKFAAFHR